MGLVQWLHVGLSIFSLYTEVGCVSTGIIIYIIASLTFSYICSIGCTPNYISHKSVFIHMHLIIIITSPTETKCHMAVLSCFRYSCRGVLSLTSIFLLQGLYFLQFSCTTSTTIILDSYLGVLTYSCN